MDPLGLALENFDVTGVWRIRDEGNPVDPVGMMYNGKELTGPADLRDALLDIPDVVLGTFTENLMAFALGRRVEYYDMPTVRAIIREASESDYRMSTFVLGVVGSQAFRMAKAGTPVAEEEDPGHESQQRRN